MKLSRILSNAVAKRIGFTVVGIGCIKHHYTHTYSEALEWAACYKLSGATIHLNGFFTMLPIIDIVPTVDKGLRKSA